MSEQIIIGAGLAGCLAGLINQNSRILERNSYLKETHQAVLRFRSPRIGEIAGITFKEVKVYKGIWHRSKPVELSPRYIALYSRKVSDTISYRSITNLSTETRWIAPDHFHMFLAEKIWSRIDFGVEISKDMLKELLLDNRIIISTMPISILAKLIGYEHKIETETKTSPIYVSKYKIEDCDVYMTYYYTDPDLKPYRASITGDTLIIESCYEIDKEDVQEVKNSFGLTGLNIMPIIENYQQPNGKIVPIDETIRKAFIFHMTVRHKIYSLGRFALWKNILMDDVLQDIEKINSMINKGYYDHMRTL